MAETEMSSLKAMREYQAEMQLQIDMAITGEPITAKLEDRWKACKEALAGAAEEINKKLEETLSPDNKQGLVESERRLVDCERALKLRQAIKICSPDGAVYWMWKLQPGEEIRDNSMDQR